ncbi:FYN-binding protein 2 [Sminthopsis crassicaudata]|uniref:FYN-binding protein 2 n=1 Tax=Sminthopsis crassicaudata TaxID=9301 RepID=UPI003D683859
MISSSAAAQSGAAVEQNCLAPEKVQLSSLSRRRPKPAYPALASNLNSCPASPTAPCRPPAACPKGSQESEELHNYEATIPFQKPSEDFISPCTDQSPSDNGIEIIAKPRKSFVHQGFSHEHASGNDKKKGKQPREGEVHPKDKDPNLKKINGSEGIPRKLQVKEDFRGKRNLLRLKPEAHGDEVYEDLYGGESGQAQTELEGKEKFKKLGRFFKKEKEKVKPKKMKKNFSGFSISMPNLEFKSQENIFYDDVPVDKKESKEKEDKGRLWKPKFLMMKDSKTNKIPEESERLLLKSKKPNSEKPKLEKEDKVLRERFEGLQLRHRKGFQEESVTATDSPRCIRRCYSRRPARERACLENCELGQTRWDPEKQILSSSTFHR